MPKHSVVLKTQNYELGSIKYVKDISQNIQKYLLTNLFFFLSQKPKLGGYLRAVHLRM